MRAFSSTRTMRQAGGRAALVVVVASLAIVQWTTVTAAEDAQATDAPATGTQAIDAQTGDEQAADAPSNGSASIGNRVWWDVDDDGVQDPDEPGLAGVNVTVTGFGADGVPGGGDDDVHSVTTDSNGEYVVDGLPGGSYRITVETGGLAAGFVPTYDLDGGIVSPDATWTGPLAAATVRRDVDFGYDGSGSIGSMVWFDQDADGVRDHGERGLDDVSVTVTWPGADGALGGDDDRMFVTTTDADGRYLVGDLPAGTLHVAVGAASLPPGFTAQTGDPDAVVDGAATVTLVAGGTDLTQNFGYAGQSSIGDTVWFDRDADGVRDSNDDGMGGVTVGLTWRGPDGVAGGHDDVAFTRTTDSSGHYSFDNLPAGNYAVDVGGLPPDYVNTFDEDLDLDSAAAVTLPAVQRHLTADFGYSGSAAVGDRVWWDIDGDGIQDPAEPGLAGVEVTATSAGPDAAAGDGDDIRFVRVTGADGRYSVSNTPQGQYTVAVTGGVPYGMAPTFDEDSSTSSPDQSARVTLGAAAHSTADFGYTGAGAVSGQLYLDLDGDGRYGTGDRGLPSVAVTVVWAGADAALDTADDISLSADTDASGAYAFAGLPTGDFSVTVDPADLPAGLAPMADPDAASDPGSNGQLHLASGQADAAQDFGYRGTGSVGDTVWLDLDGDGALSDGEPGLAMVDVDVTWAGVDGRFGTADDVVSATVTDGGGHYSVGNLPAGPYRVAIDSADMANGVQPTTDPDGGADNGSSLNLAAGVDRLEQDFSYRGDASVGGRVWVDVDADGVQDAGEPGYAGLAMTVVAAGRDGVFGSADDTAVSTVTQADGAFEVTGLPDGAVKVSYARRALSRGYVPGSDGDGADLTSARSTLTNGGAASSVDFGVRGTASLADVVWNDADGDGVRDPGEDGVAGVTVEAVWTGPLGRVVLHSVTAADGSWAFSALPPGSYTVSTTAAPSTAGMVSSTRHGVLSVLLPGGSASARLRQVPSASIGDLIWLDDDADGVRDATDPGIGGVAVRLVDERGATVATTDTDASGRYLFAGLTPEAYRVVIDLAMLPAGQRPSGDPDGVLDAMTSLTAGPGDAAMAEDFSFAPLPSVLSIGANPLRNLTLGLATVGLAVLAFAALRRRTLAVAGQRIL